MWREALAQLRHLSNDVWRGLALFMSLDALLVGLSILLLQSGHAFPSVRPCVVLAVISVLGLGLTFSGRFILQRHRVYYLQMLAKKSLLESDLGFYESRFKDSSADLAFPWRLAPEVVAEIRRDPEAWVRKSMRGPGTIARYQFLIYEVLAGFHLLVLGFVIFKLLF